MTDKDHDKDHDKDKHAADKHAADKHEPDKHEPDKRATVAAIPQPTITGSLSPADYMTEQEKAAAAKATGDMRSIPYPTGAPPPPSETIIRGQGIKGVTDQEQLGVTSKPAAAKSDK